MRRIFDFFILVLTPLSFAFAQKPPAVGVMAFEQPNNQWFEGPATRVRISADGEWALFSVFDSVTRLQSL